VSFKTRFRPTPYRDMHVGHVWVAYHCWHFAKQQCGKFVVIYDDLGYDWAVLAAQSFSLEHTIERWREDWEWLGMTPDEEHGSLCNAEAHAEAAEKLGFDIPGRYNNAGFACREIPHANLKSGAEDWHEWLTMVRVVDDYVYGIAAFVRGMDLIGEKQLYAFLRERLYDAPQIGQLYVPIMGRQYGPAKETKANEGTITIRQLRERGYTAHEVVSTGVEVGRRGGSIPIGELPHGTGNVQVPAGVLELDEIRTLPANPYLGSVAPGEWEDDAKAWRANFAAAHETTQP